jgi:hypothetical protein
MVRMISTTPIRHLLLALGLGFGLSTPAAANSYLDALKAEASSDTRPPALEPAPRDDGRPTPRTDDQVQMEEWLQTEFMGSYVFYQKLSDPKKMAIYRAYRAGAPIGELRDKINELLKQ